MAKHKVMAVFGTRPEAIKTAPVIDGLRRHADQIDTCVVATAQHRSMLDEVLELFGIEPDHDLDLMRPRQSLTDLTTRILQGLEGLIRDERPDLLLVQGDTTTAFVGGLAAFYQHVPVAHIEAGLRTGDKYNPFPEEVNRRLLDAFTDLYLAPTDRARQALLSEGVDPSKIFVTGNTVIDALLATAAREHQFSIPALRELEQDDGSKTLLVTTHRRESFGLPLESICLALRDLLDARRDLRIVFPVHLNPSVQRSVFSILGDVERVRLIEPLNYLDFVHVMKRVDLIVTDSGGVQEEAPSLDKPVLVLRDTTERHETVAAGAARLIGTDRRRIFDAVSALLDDVEAYARMQRVDNPYGDGRAAGRTVDAIRHFFGLIASPPLPFASGS